MSADRSEALSQLLARAAEGVALGSESPAGPWTQDGFTGGEFLYSNQNDRLRIRFSVERLRYPSSEVLDPRVLRIAPSSTNELHKHAHETVFVVLSGEGELRVGACWSPLYRGHVAFVPRWAMHQTRNTSATEELVVVAVTDFGLTRTLLGEYDRRCRGDGAATGDGKG